MTFVWRGAGIIVVILVAICGWITSYWFDDFTLKNTDWLGWTFFYSGILLTLIGGALAASPAEEGKAKAKNDLFWIPVWAWGLLMVGLCVYWLLISDGPAAVDTYEPEVPIETEVVPEVEAPVKTARTIRFYNDTPDSMRFVLAGKEGLIESGLVGPNAAMSADYDANTYFFASYTMDNETAISYPSSNEITEDATLYVLVEADKGPTWHRIVGAATADDTDYDDAWMIMSGKTDIAMVQVDKIYGEIEYDSVVNHDWLLQVKEILDGTDLIEPLYKLDNEGFSVKVLKPMEGLPDEAPAEDIVFVMMPFPHGQELTNQMIVDYLYGVW
jgi:hypothetical protein